MQRIFFAFILFLLCFNVSATNQPFGSNYQAYFEIHTFGYSETAPIRQIINNMEGATFDGGKHSFTHNIFEEGFKFNGWKVAYFNRYDFVLDYTPDTAEIIYSDSNNVPLEKNRVYDVYLNLIHSQSKGLKFGYEWQLKPNFIVGVDLSYLQVKRYLSGDVIGQFTATDSDYTGQLDLDYFYTKDYLLDREVSAPRGRGYALDINWRWQSTDKLWTLSGEWTDLISKITIKNAPYTTATASTDRVSFDDEGTISVKPVLSGIEGYRTESLRLPKQASVQGFYQFQPRLNMGLSLYRFGRLNFPSTLLEYRFSEVMQFNAGFEYKSDALTLGLESSMFDISVTSDRLSLDKAKTFGLDISANVDLEVFVDAIFSIIKS